MSATERSGAPDLSVVVVPFGGPGLLPGWLAALARQEDPPSLEVIVPCDERISDVEALREAFPAVRFLPLSGRRTWAEQRACGVAAARAPVVAITEDHCLPDHGWCRAIVRAHEASHAAVGGPVEKLEPDDVLGWALYLSDFGRYMGPVVEGPSAWLTDCNSSYKRRALEAIGPSWREEFHETTVNRKLCERGESLRLSPDMVVRQRRPIPFGQALCERYAFGRLFAATRVEAGPAARRFGYAALFWLVPFVRTGRAAAFVLGKRRHSGALFRSLPLVLLLDLCWAAGELAGYVTGTPGATLRPERKG